VQVLTWEISKDFIIITVFVVLSTENSSESRGRATENRIGGGGGECTLRNFITCQVKEHEMRGACSTHVGDEK
jgi:hypothetical protein